MTSPHEASQYALMNDVLYHLFNKGLRKKVKGTDIIQQLAVPLRNDIVLAYHDFTCVFLFIICHVLQDII
jgi:hypothetical protein